MSLSSSLAQAQRLYAVLSDIEQKLDGLDKKVQKTNVSYAELYNIMQDVFVLLSQAGFDEDTEETISKIRRIIIALNMLRTTMLALYATTPMGLVVGLFGLSVALGTSISVLGEIDNDRRGQKG